MPATRAYDRLKRTQQIALFNLLKGLPSTKAALRAGVNPRTLRRWAQLPDFQQALAEARQDIFSSCRSELIAAQAQAFNTLYDVAQSSRLEADRVRAASGLLEFLSRPEMSALQDSMKSRPNAVNNLAEFQAGIEGHRRTNQAQNGPVLANIGTSTDQNGHQ